MQPEFWLERWQRGETGWHQDEVNRHLLDYWPRMRIPAGAKVLVPLCGKAPDLLWLAAQGHPVLGVELSELAVRALFEDNGLEPEVTDSSPFTRYRVDELEVLRGDLFDLRREHLQDIGAVYDRASLIALPPEMRPHYCRHLDQLLGISVPRLLITLEYDQATMAGPPFSVEPREVESLLGDKHRLEILGAFDILDESPGFRARGLKHLTERVYRLAQTSNRQAG